MPAEFVDGLKTLLAPLGAVGLVAIGIVIYLLVMPEKAEKASAMIAGFVSRFAKGANKRYVRYDLQGRINDFTRDLRTDAPFLSDHKVKIQWTEPTNLDRAAFIEGNEVFVRLRRDDPKDRNFVHGSFLFVSLAMLSKVKRYISQSHRKALDLYVTTKLLEREKPDVLGFFLDEYMHPATGPSSKVTTFTDTFAIIDEAGLFFSVLLQELHFLGEKVFGQRRDDAIIREVNELLVHLKAVAERKLGEEMDLDFVKQYCRFAVVIVGRSFKIGQSPEGSPWRAFIERNLLPNDIETVYLVGAIENRPVMDRVARDLADHFHVHRTRQIEVMLRDKDGSRIKARQYQAVLRRKGVAVIRTSR